MKTFVNFTLAILLLIAFVGSGAFFVIISSDLKLERNEPANTIPPATEAGEALEE
ncbi:MAG: hypothetical protein ACSHYB_05375 [Roseibacillus sp.]